MLYGSAASLEGARRQLELQRTMGSEQRLVTPEECIAIEPALAAYRTQMAGAIHTPSECAADCLKLCIALERALRARGVRFLLDCEVQGFDRRNGRVAAVQTSAGDLEADAFVMALGTASHRLGRQLGAYLPVYPLKGYSITVDVDPAADAAPRVSVTDSARKVVFARIGSRLRVAGMAELVGHDASIPATRIETLAAATRARLPAGEPPGGAAPLDRHAPGHAHRRARSSGAWPPRLRTCCSTPATARWASRWPSARRSAWRGNWRLRPSPRSPRACSA